MIDSFKGQYFFLSNFSDSLLTFDGIDYPTVEHYYVAMKVGNSQLIDGKQFDLMDVREMISKIPTASKVKKFGRGEIQLRDDWDNIKYDVMYRAVGQKFRRHEKLKELLLGTGDVELVEGNWWGDIYWGICDGVGENNLGKILMTVRSEILKEEKENSLETILKNKE